jgi:hypothetical protein
MKKQVKKQSNSSVERLMVMFTLYFITGVLIMMFVPSGSPVKPIAMTLYSVAVFGSVFRFGV